MADTQTPQAAQARRYPTGNYGPIAAFTLVDAACDHLEERHQRMTPGAIGALSQILARAAFAVTSDVFGQAAWEHGAFSRVAYALRSTLAIRPAPFDGTDQDWSAWEANLAGLTRAKAIAAMDLMEAEVFDPAAHTYFTAQAIVTA